MSILGEGGMGSVYVARDTRLDRVVALKVLRADKARSAATAGEVSEGAARLVREARSAASLEHPNVVTVYEVGQVTGDDGESHPFIAMELVKGRALRAFCGDASVPLPERIRWLREIASALQAAHEAGLVHRDIKPENVMIRQDGRVKVLDFGLAKQAIRTAAATSSTDAQILPSITAKGVAVGTPYYMAPEQMRREPLDGRADQFAWAVMAYELLSGEPPWGREVDALELVSKLLTHKPPPLCSVAPLLPERVGAAVDRALEKKRADRFLSMADLLAELAETHATLPSRQDDTLRRPSAPPDSEPTAAAKPPPRLDAPAAPRRSRALGYAAGGGAMLALAGVVVWTITARPTGGDASVPAASMTAPHITECTRSTECVTKLGAPAVCNPAGRCARIESLQCGAHFEPGDLQRDDTVWIGGMFPIGVKDEIAGRGDANALELGRRDFAGVMSGYRAPNGTPAPRPLATVVCDTAGGDAEPARHLVEDLGVPVLVDGQRSRAFLGVARSTYVPGGVLAIASEAISPLVAQVAALPGHPRLVFRTSYNDASTAQAIAALVGRLESEAGKTGALAGGRPFRVALLRDKSTTAGAFAEALFGALVFNGKSALDNGNAYLERTYLDDAELDGASADTARHEPDVIVVSGPTAALPKVEARWPKGSRRKPTYLLPTILVADDLAFIGRAAERRRRVYGFTLASTRVTNARFVVHYNETFDEKMSRATSPNSTYDAFYVAAFATMASGAARQVTGEVLAATVAKLLPPGPRVDVGPSGIFTAYGPLSRGEGIDLVGAGGDLDFDVSTGDAPADFAVVCADVDGEGRAIDNVESGLFYSSAARGLQGAMRCP